MAMPSTTQDQQTNLNNATTTENTPMTNNTTAELETTILAAAPTETTTNTMGTAATVTPGHDGGTSNANDQITTTATTTVNHGTNTATSHHSHHNTMTYNIMFPAAANEGPLTKVCRLLGSSGNPMLGARLSQQVFEGMFTPEANSTPETRILVFGDQPAPFPLLAVIKPENKVIVLHGIKRLGVAFGVQHPNKGHTLAFVNDADQDTELPPILKLTPNDFADTQAWFCPDLGTIMNTDTTHTTVLPVPEGDSIINTAKIIPIPLFLVPLFINGGHPRNAAAMVQAFHDDFYAQAPIAMQQQTQYILNFLCAAAGFDVSNANTAAPPSQLALETEYLTWDPILYQWALNRFGGILQIARHADNTSNDTTSANATTRSPDTNQTQTATAPPNTTNGSTTNTQPNITQTFQNNRNNNATTTTTTPLPQLQTQNTPMIPNIRGPHIIGNQNITTPHINIPINPQAPFGNYNVTTTPANINRINHQQQHTPFDTIDLTHGDVTPLNYQGQQHHMPTLNDTQPTNNITQNSATNANRFPELNCYPGLNSFPGTNRFPQNTPMGNMPNIARQYQITSPPTWRPGYTQPAMGNQHPNQNTEGIPDLMPLTHANLPPFPLGRWQRPPPRATLHQTQYQQQGYQPPQNDSPYPQHNQTNRLPPQIDPNIVSIISGAFQTALTAMQQQQNHGNANGGLQTSGKSAKILQGTNRYSLLGFCGLTIQDEVPEIFRIFDSNEDSTAKFQALEDLLLMAQHGNALVNFTLRKETFKDMKQHQFWFDPDEKNTTRGFSPFCLQKMDRGSEIALRQLEERMERATYTSVNDLTKRDQSLKFSPITEPLTFLTAIANTHALAWALFTNASPLTQGLQELQLLMLRHLHKGKLACAATFQADWFAYVLWGIYECIDTFFAMCLTETDLREGAALNNPLAALHQELLNCPPFYRMGCPAVLLTCPRLPQANNTDTTTQQQRDNTKRSAGNPQRELGQNGYGAKRPRLHNQHEPQPHATENYWNENKKFDPTLKQIKQTILQRQRTNLGQVLRANGMTTPEALQKLNLPTTLCGRYTMWGGCSDPTCTLRHDDTPLNHNNIQRIKAFLTDGARKLANPPQLQA